MTSTTHLRRVPLRRQRTLAREAVVNGVSLFRGADVSLRFRPAPEDHGIAFQRTDLPGTQPVPALIDYVTPSQRRTAISHVGVTIETIEHVMAALAGLQIDNCLVQLDAVEPPAGDGSAQVFVDALLEAGIEEQQAIRQRLLVTNKVHLFSLDHQTEISAAAATDGGFKISYELDYGHPHLPAQSVTVTVTPQSFVDAISFARTFVLEQEIDALRQQGYGKRMTTDNLLVFGPQGVIGNTMHTPDECARHKILDAIGDLALIGCDLIGRFRARRSGHRHNHELVRDLLVTHPHARTRTPSAA